MNITRQIFDNLKESYEMGTMTEEQFDTICEKLGISTTDVSGGIIRFKAVNIDVIIDLLNQGLIDGSMRQNDSPSIQEMIDFCHYHNENTKNYTMDGYVVVPRRSDSRVTVDGIDFDYDDDALEDINEFFKDASETSLEDNHAGAWWD